MWIGCTLTHFLTRRHKENRALAEAIGPDRKGRRSLVAYALGIALAFVHPWLGFAVYVGVAVMWFVPDRRIEKTAASAPSA